MTIGAHSDALLVALALAYRLQLAVEVQYPAGFLVPTWNNRVGPEVAASLIIDAPSQWLVTRVAGEVVGGVDLDAVTVGIAQVQVERVRHAVAAGAAFNVVEFVGGAQGVARLRM